MINGFCIVVKFMYCTSLYVCQPCNSSHDALQEVEVMSLQLPKAIKEGLITSSTTLMQPTWQWLVKVLDVAQGQLEQGEMFDTTVCNSWYELNTFTFPMIELCDVTEGTEPSASRGNASAIFLWLLKCVRSLRLFPCRLSHVLVKNSHCRAA